MILILHISIALFSIIFATISLASPSRFKIKVANGSVIATLLTGSYLVVSTGSNMLSACITGLIYTAVATSIIFLAKRRIAN